MLPFLELGHFFFCFFGIEGIKDCRNRQFPATVNTGINQIFRIKFKIKPRTAVRNNPRRKQFLARRDGLAFVVVKEDARASVHLRNNHALGSVDDKRSLFGHQRNIAHKHILLFTVVDRFGAGRLVHVKHRQPERNFHRRGVCQIAANALVNVVFRLRQLILDKLKQAVTGKITDGENGFENFFQTELTVVAIHINIVDKAVV